MTAKPKRVATTITIHVPLKFAVRGGRKMIIGQVPQQSRAATRTRPDNALIKLISRAHCWRTEIESGNYISITELAKNKRVNQSYACRVLRLTLLSPQIIEAILNGHISNLTTDVLMRPQPARWDVQLEFFQINHSIRQI